MDLPTAIGPPYGWASPPFAPELCSQLRFLGTAALCRGSFDFHTAGLRPRMTELCRQVR